jgi:hypothetical protein
MMARTGVLVASLVVLSMVSACVDDDEAVVTTSSATVAEMDESEPIPATSVPVTSPSTSSTTTEVPTTSPPLPPLEPVPIEYAVGVRSIELHEYEGELERGPVMDIVVGPDDVPFVVVYEGSFSEEAAHNAGSLFLIACEDPGCTTLATSRHDLDDVDAVSLASSPEGIPVLAYNQYTWNAETQKRDSWSTVIACAEFTCDSFEMTELPEIFSAGAAISVGDDGATYVAGSPVWNDEAPPENLPLAICDEPTCASGPRIVTVELGESPFVTGFALDSGGLPRFAGMSERGSVVVSCQDSDCEQADTWIADPFDERWGITPPQIAGGAAGPMALASMAEPMSAAVSYRGPTLWVWDDDPADAVRIELDDDARLGPPPGVAVGADGRPAVAWMRLGPAAQSGEVELMLARCDDRTCTTGTIATLARGLRYTERVVVTVGPDGSPAVLFVDENQEPPVLTLARCHDPACAESALVLQPWSEG